MEESFVDPIDDVSFPIEGDEDVLILIIFDDPGIEFFQDG